MLTKALQGAALATQPAYIEDVFSTYLYTGTGSSQTITNNIDTTTYGGLVWIKGRSGATGHRLTDTARGTTKSLESNSTAAEATESTGLTAFGTTGFTIGADADYNTNAATYVSWTFREKAKFFDVVTYTGNGVAGRTIAHNLGSVPGCMIVKNLTTGGTGWVTYHRSLGNTKIIELNSTAAAQVQNEWNNTDPTSTVFSVYSGYGTNFNGDSYVAYLFAHDAGGFGAAGTDNVISCGSYTSNGSTISVNLGWEPQWILIKRTSNTGNWCVTDNMRGMTAAAASASAPLFPNTSDAELAASSTNGPAINATGFTVPYSSSAFNYPSGETYIYIAIRRGPMKTPTSGTSVFTPAFASSSGAYTATAGFPVDAVFYKSKSTVEDNYNRARLLGAVYLVPNSTAAEVSNANGQFDSNTAFFGPVTGNFSAYINWMFRRAPGFFDVVCYTGTGADRTVTHNLGVVPEMIIFKRRDTTGWWNTYHVSLGAGNVVYLHRNLASSASNFMDGTTPTSTQFTLDSADIDVNASGGTYVAYLFASVTGVSKVGSYTGNGSNQTINCGFTAGARFVMIKRTDSTGDWVTFDTARGIVSGNDPALYLNSTAAEVTGIDAIDPDNSGFIVNQETTFNLNVNNASYIFLAVS